MVEDDDNHSSTYTFQPVISLGQNSSLCKTFNLNVLHRLEVRVDKTTRWCIFGDVARSGEGARGVSRCVVPTNMTDMHSESGNYYCTFH